MTKNNSCNLGSLDEYKPSEQNPWDTSRILHLYRRAAFGASKQEVITALQNGDPSELVDQLIDDAINLAPTTAPEWIDWDLLEFKADIDAGNQTRIEDYRTINRNQMVYDMIHNKTRDRLTMFWSGLLVTQYAVYSSPAYQSQYYELLQRYALGNFKDFIHELGLSNPMLVYLNGDENVKEKPNENYARELYELFTLGVDNGYTEDDIQETAKALTGYVKEESQWGDIIFNPDQFNTEEKTIFGRTGNWGYDDVIDILFEERPVQIANYICGKFYNYFVSPTTDETIVSQLAQTFVDTNFEIAPVLRQLFKSEHFFDIYSIGAIMKSPIDAEICLYNELGLESELIVSIEESNTSLINWIGGNTAFSGQDLLNPPSVKGWAGGEDWYTTEIHIRRRSSLFNSNYNYWIKNKEQFKEFLIGLPKGTLEDGFITDDLEGAEVYSLINAIIKYFLPRGIQDPIFFEEVASSFKDIDAFPSEYYDADAMQPNIWSMQSPHISYQFYQFIYKLVILPEFQIK